MLLAPEKVKSPKGAKPHGKEVDIVRVEETKVQHKHCHTIPPESIIRTLPEHEQEKDHLAQRKTGPWDRYPTKGNLPKIGSPFE